MLKFVRRRATLQSYLLAAMVVPATFGIGGAVWACADTTCRPGWYLGVATFDCAGQAILSPGNDTRINMLWLMRSLAAMPARVTPPADHNNPQFGRTFLSWSGLRAALWPAPATAPQPTLAATPASPCETYADGVPAFAAALAAEAGVPAAERTVLNQLRTTVGCGEVAWNDGAVSSRTGRAYLAYLKAAEAFYTKDWTGAQQGFAALTTSKSRWIAETATYMPIRIALRSAIAKAVDDYGDFAGLKRVDSKAVASARDAIAAYLKRYPKGRYAGSAKGLTRRVAWLSGDTAGLARTYETLLATTSGEREEAADLAEEIDNKLLEDAGVSVNPARLRDTPLLLAIADLKRMRRDTGAAAGPSAADLAAQKPQFAAHADLYDLIEATRAYYAGENPRGVLTLLPDAARAKSFTPLAFSRQVLRGMALAKAKDPNEAGFWRELMPGASPFYQRPLVQMGLAIRWQHDGKLDQAFASGSPITDSMTREILLQTVASPAIVRGAAKDTSRPPRERDIARFTLLYKDLANGAFADFSSDVALVPGTATSKANLWDFSIQDEIPVGLFRSGQWSDGSFACGPLAQTAAALARSAKDHKAQLCLGEFYRLNGFDGFGLFRADAKEDLLGAGPDGFPGKALSRSDLYAAVIADRQAPADQRAYALYRAVMCYAPSRNNGCAGAHMFAADSDAAQAPIAVRKGWFTELKQRYPNSQWAKTLPYYW